MWGRISATCVVLMWWNGTKCKYMFMLPLKNLAPKGLNKTFKIFQLHQNLFQDVQSLLWISISKTRIFGVCGLFISQMKWTINGVKHLRPFNCGIISLSQKRKVLLSPNIWMWMKYVAVIFTGTIKRGKIDFNIFVPMVPSFRRAFNWIPIVIDLNNHLASDLGKLHYIAIEGSLISCHRILWSNIKIMAGNMLIH